MPSTLHTSARLRSRQPPRTRYVRVETGHACHEGLTSCAAQAAGINHFIQGLTRANTALAALAIRSTSLAADSLAYALSA
jgi:hypothetical protein